MNAPANTRIQLNSIIIFSTALIARLLFDLYLRHTYAFYNFPNTDDVGYYLSWAQEISRQSWIGHETFMGLPLYPYFLAVLDRLLGGHMPSIRLAHMVLGSLNCVLIYMIAQKIFTHRVAMLAGFLSALSFTGMYFDRLLMPPVLLVSLGGIIVFMLLTIKEEKAAKQWLLLGLLIGLAVLGDGKFLFFFIFIAMYKTLNGRRHLAQTVKYVLIPLCIGVALIIFLTGLRNRLVGGEWIWISGQSGLNLFYGNNPQAKGYFENPQEFRPTHTGQDIDLVLTAEKLSGRKLTPRQASAFYRDRAVQFIVQEPFHWIKLLGKKAYIFLGESEYTFDMDLIFLKDVRLRMDLNPFGLIAPLAFIGLVVSRKKEGSAYLNLLVASQFLFVMVFYLLNRYRATVVPFLIIFESTALIWLVEHIHQKKYTKVFLSVLFVLCYMMIFQPRSIADATRSFLYFSKAGYVFETEGQLDLAKEAYVNALKIQPDDATALYNLGNIRYAQKDPEGARKFYESVIAINPIHVDAYFNLGAVQEDLGDLSAAQSAYLKVIELTPGSIDAMYRLGQMYIREGQCEYAKDWLDRIVRLNPHFSAEVYSLLNTCNNN